VTRPHPESQILVYADGSCLGNPGPGGWGVVIVGPDGKHEYSGSDPRTTNNRMEMTAAIEGLRQLPAGARVLLRSDSQYLVKSINFGWKRNANVDLWSDLDEEIARRRVRFEWVRGHAGDRLNERADRLALEAAKHAADARRKPKRPAPMQLPSPVQIAPPAQIAQIAPPVQSGRDDEATLNALRPLLKEGESIRRCACCGGNFVAPQRYTASYCALAACQLERRAQQASQV
jgi:ribonuclease HI